MKKIAFFDIDGTLIGFDGKQHSMPESTRIALKKFRDNGNLAFICSGRPIRFIFQEFGEDMFDGYISANGTYIVYEGKCIYNKIIDIIKINKLMESFDALGIKSSFIGPYKGYSFKMEREEIQKYNYQFKGDPYLIQGWKIDDIQANVMDIFYKDEMHLKECRDYFGDRLIFNTHGEHMSADVSFKDFDKSSGINYITKFLNISLEDTFAFGDGYNDITMFKTVNIGIAMGNAVENLKNIASYVTDDIFEDGIYNAMIKYRLINE